jgi:hypothetical protein
MIANMSGQELLEAIIEAGRKAFDPAVPAPARASEREFDDLIDRQDPHHLIGYHQYHANQHAGPRPSTSWPLSIS